MTNVAGQPDEHLDVRIAQGVVRGVRFGRIRSWRGIPYAAPPVGASRLRAPRPPTPWQGVRSGAEYGNVAPQVFRGQFRATGPGLPSGEDCLTVNVLKAVPLTDTGDLLPVMVFIHGGGYSAGSSRDFSGQGEGFVRSGRVVYVSFNYRLGALGYLDFTQFSTPERPFDSNLGLRDQVAALQWVQQNIREFGGDPDNVTLFGESAGGNAVTTLFATPSAEGLFARAIAQSAPPNAVYDPRLTEVWAREYLEILRQTVGRPDDERRPKNDWHPHDDRRSSDLRLPRDERRPRDLRLLRDVRILRDDWRPNAARRPHNDSSADPAELLDSASPGEFVSAALTLAIRTPDAYPGAFCFAPVVDGDFLPERPVEMFRAGRAHPVPLIIGTNDREGSIFRGRVDILPRTVARIKAVLAGTTPKARALLREAYPGLPARRPSADFGGDYGFWYPSTRIADFHSRYQPVYFYRFDMAPRLLHLVGLDATHGVEMLTLFGATDIPIARTITALGGREEFAAAGERMRAHWLDFACTGQLTAGWPEYREPTRLTLVIDDSDRVESDPRAGRRIAWNAAMTTLADPVEAG